MRYAIVIVLAVIVSGCATTGNRSTIEHSLAMMEAEQQYQEVLGRSLIR